MTDNEIQREITAERTELATILTDLPAAKWDTPSLCAGWRVREVVAHITMQYRYSTPKFLWEMLKSGGSFNRMIDRCSRRDATTVTADELAGTLRDNASVPWKPPGGGFEGALTHDVVHGLDFTVPLGIDRRVPEHRLRIVLGGLASDRGLRYFGVDLTGIELRAEDMDWRFGSGTPVYGAAQDLVLVLCGRKLPAGRLRGDGSNQFSRQSSAA